MGLGVSLSKLYLKETWLSFQSHYELSSKKTFASQENMNDYSYASSGKVSLGPVPQLLQRLNRKVETQSNPLGYFAWWCHLAKVTSPFPEVSSLFPEVISPFLEVAYFHIYDPVPLVFHFLRWEGGFKYPYFLPELLHHFFSSWRTHSFLVEVQGFLFIKTKLIFHPKPDIGKGRWKCSRKFKEFSSRNTSL